MSNQTLVLHHFTNYCISKKEISLYISIYLYVSISRWEPALRTLQGSSCAARPFVYTEGKPFVKARYLLQFTGEERGDYQPSKRKGKKRWNSFFVCSQICARKRRSLAAFQRARLWLHKRTVIIESASHSDSDDAPFFCTAEGQTQRLVARSGAAAAEWQEGTGVESDRDGGKKKPYMDAVGLRVRRLHPHVAESCDALDSQKRHRHQSASSIR